MSYIIKIFMQDVRLRPKCPLQWTQHKTKTTMSLTSRVKLVSVCLPLCFVAGNCSSKHVFGYLGINHIDSYLTTLKSSSCPTSQSWWSTMQLIPVCAHIQRWDIRSSSMFHVNLDFSRVMYGNSEIFRIPYVIPPFGRTTNIQHP